MRVLLVEDNPGDVILVRTALSEAGINCELLVIRDGVDALRFVNRMGEFRDAPKPNLIVLDWRLPYRDGAEVLRELKRNDTFNAVPVVVHSAIDSADEKKKAYDLGGDAWVTKTSDIETYLREFASAVKFWLDGPLSGLSASA